MITRPRFSRITARLLVSLVAVLTMIATFAVPRVNAEPPPKPDVGRGQQVAGVAGTGQGTIQQLAQRVRKLIKVVEGGDLPCETRNQVITRLRGLNDTLESGRPSATRALLIAWMNDARSSVSAGVLTGEQAATLHNGMDEVLAQVPEGWSAKPRPTKHWKPLPSCSTPTTEQVTPQLEMSAGSAGTGGRTAGAVLPTASYTPEIADFDANDALIIVSSWLSMVPIVGPLLSALASLLWPVNAAPDINKLIDSAIDTNVQGQLVNDLNDLQTRSANFAQQIVNWKSDCPNWETVADWGDNANCGIGATATYERFKEAYDTFTGYRSHFQWQTPVDYRVKLLPLFTQFQTLFLSLLRDGLLLQQYWTATGKVLPTDVETPRKAMTIELDPTPTAAEYGTWGPGFQNYNVGLNYVNATYELGLSQQPAANNDANWNERNRYNRDMAAYVLDFRDVWKYFDPQVYEDGVPAGIRHDRMIYSDLVGGVTDWGAFKQPENVTGPLTELTLWAEHTFDMNYYSNLIPEALQATSPPTAGPARAGAITGNASFDHRDELDPTAVSFFDLRTRGPIIKVTTTRDQGMAISYPDWFPSSVSLTFARGGNPVKIGDGTHDVRDWAYPGYVLATAAVEGTWTHTGNRGETVADSIVFGFRRADSFAPSAAAVSLQSGKCLDGGTAVSGSATRIWTCHAGPNQIWTYDIATKQLTTFDNLELADAAKPSTRIKFCLTASGTTRGSAATISACTGALSQQWDLVASADNQHGLIKSVQSGLVLDVASGGTANGTAVILWTQAGGPNQLWNLPPRLQSQQRNVATGRCLDVSDPALPNGAVVHQWGCHAPGDTHTNQLWTYDQVEKQLTVGGQQKCLQATGSTAGSGVVISDCGGSNWYNQQWELNTDGTITSTFSGLALEVAGSSTANGATIRLTARNASAKNQLWSRPGEQGAQVYALGAGKCLDLPAFSTNIQALIEDCNNTTTQRWTYHPLLQRFTVSSATGTGGATFCLGADGTGSAAVINPCGSDPTQRWALVRGPDGVTSMIRNLGLENACLSLPGTTRVTARLTNVTLESCRPDDDALRVNQQWVVGR